MCITQCNDDRFNAIAKAKKDLIESTNISSSNDEINVLDNLLFRCHQMGWLNKYNTLFGFSEVIKYLEQGKLLARRDWLTDKFIVKQNVNEVGVSIIPNMTSLPREAKNIILSRRNPKLTYINQMLIIDTNGVAESYIPSSEDIFAKDWYIVNK